MITGAIRSQVDKVWDAFWSGGVSNPLKTKIEDPIFKKKQANLSWSRFKDFEAETAKDLLQMCKTKKTELLFLALFLAQLKAGGRCAAIVPDVIKQFGKRNPKKKSDRKAKSFFVPVEEIRENKYDLSINRYKEIEYEEVEYDPPVVILDQLEALEKEIAKDLKQLRKMVTK